MCWFYNVNTQGLTDSGFMEKLGIEPATPGLQDIGLSPTPRRLLNFFVTFLGINQFPRVGWLCRCARLFISALWSPVGKGLPSWLLFVASDCNLSLSHWYPGLGVVLHCIDS